MSKSVICWLSNSLRIMNMKLFLLLGFICAASATFLPPFTAKATANSSASASSICIYSHDPDKYKPNCFVCPNVVYPHALIACINVTTMPSNISFSQANCMDKNCAINYPMPPEPKYLDKSLDVQQVSAWVDLIKKTFSKRSVPNNNVDDQALLQDEGHRILLKLRSMNLLDPNFNVVVTQRVQTFASDAELDYSDY